MKFIDIHNHILNGIDDGARTYDDTLKMLKMAESNNIEKLIVTSHFKEGVVENYKDIIVKKYNEANDIIKEYNIKVEIFPGCEIFLSENTNDLLNKKIIQTLNNSNYVLIETHRSNNNMAYDLKEELYNLAVDNFKVIIAHPERYEFTHENPNKIYDFIKEGNLIQINVTSLDEKNYNHKIVRKLLDNNLVHFVATDAHDLINRPLRLEHGYNFIKSKYGQNKADELFYYNQLKVINNERIDISDMQKIKEKKYFIF